MGRNRCESAGKMSRLTVDTGRRSISRLDIIQLLLLPYLDPGSGSFLIQILIAAVLGGILSARLWIGRILGVFRRSSSPNRTANSLADPDLDEADLDNGKGPGDAK